MTVHRVVTLLPSATEIVAALGFSAQIIGRSHECDYPAEVADRTVCTAPRFKVEGSSAEIDSRVNTIVRDGLSVYAVDAPWSGAHGGNSGWNGRPCNGCWQTSATG